jgi:hypothetical protein
MAKIEDLGDRLKKLVPMLGSDRDGEVANAARVITKILKESGLDWHDVTKKLCSSSQSGKSGGSSFNADEYYNWAKRYYQDSYRRDDQQDYNERYYKNQQKKKKEGHVYWEEKENGNFTGDIFGRNCTVFKSKHNPGLWDAVINEFGAKTIWKKGYKTADMAKKAVEFFLDPEAKDDW